MLHHLLTLPRLLALLLRNPGKIMYIGGADILPHRWHHPFLQKLQPIPHILGTLLLSNVGYVCLRDNHPIT